ncbi:hypothetical protein [Fibrobacter sp. UWP2]|uniref:hypothetical protein n=1 Tax=Fibrobacter sp. UWP2 TaxID=1896216 RepID=UPI00091A6D1A|nr:hypothetical protein [Fibrobacter sp. UWP2]SHI35106.1 hypothetical protein SAMN05720471_101251 [Fibrobacter sp. UWP2]
MAMSSRDVLDIDWAGRARALLDSAGAKPAVKAPAQLWPGDTYNLVEPEQKPDNIVYRTLSNPQLNRGLQNIAEAVPEAIIGEGTGNSVGDILLGFTGPGAAVGTAATGNKPGALDMLPGGGIIKAGLVGLVKAGKTAEAKAIYNILKNPIANRFANRYPEEALQSLSKFVDKHPALKNMNTAEVYDVMQSGKLGNDFFIDLGKDYPEAVKRVMSTNEIAYTTHDGKRVSLSGIADELDKNYGKEFTAPLNKLLDRVDAMVYPV